MHMMNRIIRQRLGRGLPPQPTEEAQRSAPGNAGNGTGMGHRFPTKTDMNELLRKVANR